MTKEIEDYINEIAKQYLDVLKKYADKTLPVLGNKKDPNEVIILPKGLENYWDWYYNDKDDNENIECDHIWILYTGFNEQYYYCEKCPATKPLDEDDDGQFE